jgi:4-amino-4-deoxy-L-arabinose transferase-like glycosyltransferase
VQRLGDVLFAQGEEADDARRRRAAAWVVTALAGMGFCLSTIAAFSMPVLFGADERAHLAYVEVLLDGRLPTVDTDVPVDGHFMILDSPEEDATGPHDDVWIANHPPLTSVLAAPPAWLAAELGIERGPQMVLRLLCASGMAVGVLASAAVADVLLPGRRRTAILAAGLVALTPSVLSIASYGYNDGLALATGTSLLAVTLRVARTGPSRARFVATLALGSAAVLTRSSLLPLIGLAVVVWVVRAAMDRDRRGVGAALLVALVPALAGGWFYLRNLDLYGDLTGASYLQDKFGRDPQGSTWELLADPVFLVGAWQDLWGSFRYQVGIGSGEIIVGSRNPQIGSRVVVGAVLVALAALGWLTAIPRLRRPSRTAALTWGAALAWVVVTVVGMASFVGGGGTPHPRYLFPAMAVSAAIVMEGLSRLPGGRWWGPAVLVGFAVLDVYLLGVLQGVAQ